MNTRPKISVIVPVYNTEKYLRECVDSILAQTFTDFELILVDDGSTDQSGVICDEYAQADARVRVFHKPNGGVSSARNLGLDNAQGEWIVFADADDILPDESLSIRFEAISKDNADLVFFRATFFGNMNFTLGPDENKVYHDLQSFQSDLPNYYPYIGTLWDKIYRKDAIALLRFDETMSLAEDHMFNVSFLWLCQRIKLDTANVYRYRIYDDVTLSRNFTLKMLPDIDKSSIKSFEFACNDAGRDVVLLCYINGINRTIIKYLGNKAIPDGGKVNGIMRWYNNSLLRQLPLNKWNSTWQQYCLRLFLKSSMLRLFQTLLMIKHRISVD